MSMCARLRRALVRADGIALTPLIFPSIEEITFRFTKLARMGCVGAFVRQVHLADVARRRRNGCDPGVSLARASSLGDLRAQRPRHQDREGPGEPHRRNSRMGADRRHLRARLPGGGVWRRSRQDPLAAGRRQRARPDGEGRAQAAVGHPLRIPAGDQPQRHAGEWRGRCGDFGPCAAGVRRRGRGGAALSRTTAPRRNATSRRPASSRSCI